MTENPILEANPASLDELFSRDPFGYAEADIDAITTKLRQMRNAWENGVKITKSSTPKKSSEGPSLEELGLL